MTKRIFQIEPFDQDSDEDRYIVACARLRNITPHALVKRLIATIAHDQLAVAILDDSDAPQARGPHEHRFRDKGSEPPRPRYGGKEYPL